MSALSANEPQSLLGELDVFFGNTSSTAARIYARCPAPPGERDLRLTGRIHGPHCVFSQTLPFSTTMSDLGQGASDMNRSTLVASAWLSDPCFWSEDSPFAYKVHVELHQGSQLVAEAERWLGIRPCGAVGNRLWLAAKRWVPRGVRREHAPQAALADWRESMTVMNVHDPAPELCQTASEVGVRLFVRLLDLNPSPARLRDLAGWPAVAVVILPRDAVLDPLARAAAPNLLFAQALGNDHSHLPAAWADLVVVTAVESDGILKRAVHLELPMLVEASPASPGSLAEFRARCDQTQAQLAGVLDPAGFLA